jgi:hypothetical protein
VVMTAPYRREKDDHHLAAPRPPDAPRAEGA